MNNHLPEAIRTALAPFAPKLDADPSPIKARPALRTASNDAPEYIRASELDTRVMIDGKFTGALGNSDAWFNSDTGKYQFFLPGFNPNSKQWLPIVAAIDTPEALRERGLL